MLVENKLKSDSSGPLLQIEKLHVNFQSNQGSSQADGRRQIIKAVDGVDLTVSRGEIMSIVGESGSGKTTLARSVVGLTKPTSGRIFVGGDEVKMNRREDLKRLWKTTQMVFQDPYSAFNPLQTVEETLEIPLRRFGLVSTYEELIKKMDEVLTQVGLSFSELQDKYPSQLSGGQRQRLAIARAVVINPSLIVADEPVSMLDVSVRAGILDLIKGMNKARGLTVIMITHDLAVAEYLSDRIAVMYAGKVVELGQSTEVISSPIHPYTELLINSTPKLKGNLESFQEHEAKPGVFTRGGSLGCNFYPRCPISVDICPKMEPQLVDIGDGHSAACFVRAPDQVLNKTPSSRD